MAVPWIAGSQPQPTQAQKWLPAVEVGETITISFRRFEGGSWVEYTAVPKVWMGNGWAVKRPKRWDGAMWVAMT